MRPRVSDDVMDLEVNPDPAPETKPIRHRQWGGATFGLLFGLFALALGRTGHLWPEMDVAAQFGAQALCIVSGFAIAAFMPRFKALAGLVLTGTFILAYGMWPLIVSQNLNKGPFQLASGERQVRLVQFNIWSMNTNSQAIVDEITRLDGDIVGLEEMGANKREILFRLRTNYPFQYSCTEVLNCDFAIISRVPFLAASGTMNWKSPPHAVVKLGGRLEGLTVFALHILRFPMSRVQLQQTNALARRLESETGQLVVMGDFNATPFSRVTSQLSEATGLRRLTSLPSWPSWAGLPQLAIDHVFVSKDIRPLASAQLGNPAGSDHFPLVINVALPKN